MTGVLCKVARQRLYYGIPTDLALKNHQDRSVAPIWGVKSKGGYVAAQVGTVGVIKQAPKSTPQKKKTS